MATVLAASIDARELALLLPLLHHQAACMKRETVCGHYSVRQHVTNADSCQAQRSHAEAELMLECTALS